MNFPLTSIGKGGRRTNIFTEAISGLARQKGWGRRCFWGRIESMSESFSEIVSAMLDWDLTRTLVKGESIFRSGNPLSSESVFASIEIQTSDFLPPDMLWFWVPNSNRIVTTPAFLQRITRYLDAWANAEDLQTVA